MSIEKEAVQKKKTKTLDKKHGLQKDHNMEFTKPSYQTGGG